MKILCYPAKCNYNEPVRLAMCVYVCIFPWNHSKMVKSLVDLDTKHISAVHVRTELRMEIGEITVCMQTLNYGESQLCTACAVPARICKELCIQIKKGLLMKWCVNNEIY